MRLGDGMKDLHLVYYGDDFTGSTDCLEVLATNGLDTVLFLKSPDLEYISERFPDVECIGIAGLTRSMNNEQLTETIPPVLEFMKQLPAKVLHYKICSTFDSSPEVGNIGLVIELAHEAFEEQTTIPLVVGAPALRRYTVFGNHFAAAGEQIYRLDRHPTMSKHPITPMDESDLRLVLKRQSESSIALMDLFGLDGEWESVTAKFEQLMNQQPGVLLFDVLDEERLRRTGQLIWENAEAGHRFVVGSSGIEYALTAYWNQREIASNRDSKLEPIGNAEQILVISGSCSPVTRQQILFAMEQGMQGIQLPLQLLFEQDEHVASAWQQVLDNACQVLQRGQSLILYTALGPDDPGIQYVREKTRMNGTNSVNTGEMIGRLLGKMAKELIYKTGIQRMVIAGGDTSGFAVNELDINALRMLSQIEPGGPLCRAYSNDVLVDQLQIALKGGQVGSEAYFLQVMKGKNLVR